MMPFLLKKSDMKKILAAFGMASPAGRKQLAGLYRYIAGGRDWDVTMLRHGNLWEPDTIRRQIAEGCNGIISAQSFTKDKELLRLLEKDQIPVVVIDFGNTESGTARTNNVRVGHIYSDDFRAGVSGTQHLLSLGRMRAYGFIPSENLKSRWSRLRAEGAESVLAAKGLPLKIFDSAAEPLEQWLLNLPKPAAVIAASDDLAAAAAILCHKLRISIPDQLVLLGNDDDELTCENVRPRLSSVRIPHEEEGYRAAHMLDLMMRRPDRAPKDVLIPPNGITVRESTKPISPATGLIDRALTYIRENAASGISVNDVAANQNVSRRLLYLRFEEMVGKTVLGTITERRIELLKQRLKSTKEPISALSLKCGFSSANHAKRVFKSATGMSMRDWRAAAGARPSQSPSAGDRQGDRRGSGSSPAQPRRRTSKAGNRR